MTSIIIGTTPTITYKFKIVSTSDFRACIIENRAFDTLYGEE